MLDLAASRVLELGIGDVLDLDFSGPVTTPRLDLLT